MPREIKMIFSKPLTETDIKKRLAIPSNSLPELPEYNGSCAVKIPLMHGTKSWQIVCSVRKEGYKKPVFSGGWRNFVRCNDLRVGDELTLYKVQEDDGSSHYKVEVQKPAATRPSEDLLPPALSVNHQVDEITGTSSVEHDKKQLPMADDAPVKEEGAVTEPANAIAIVPSVDYVTAKSPNIIFGTGRSGEAASKAHFKDEHEPEIKLFGTMIMSIDTRKGEAVHDNHMTKTSDLNVDGGSPAYGTGHAAAGMGEPFRTYYHAKPFDLNVDGDSPAYGSSHAAAEACYKSMQRFSLDWVPPQPTTYEGEVNLDLTLAQPIIGISSI